MFTSDPLPYFAVFILTRHQTKFLRRPFRGQVNIRFPKHCQRPPLAPSISASLWGSTVQSDRPKVSQFRSEGALLRCTGRSSRGRPAIKAQKSVKPKRLRKQTPNSTTNTSISRDLEENVSRSANGLRTFRRRHKENKRRSMHQWQKSVQFPWK